ncbi:MAG: YbaY family lipoprotein [Campylobacterales bacterium]|nr:YbaY family lipoprotein [Campylobacterales bacterium]
MRRFWWVILLVQSLEAMRYEEESGGYEGALYLSIDLQQPHTLPKGSLLDLKIEALRSELILPQSVASKRIEIEGKAPFAIRILLDPATLDGSLQYTIRATISFNNRLLYSSQRPFKPRRPQQQLTLERLYPQ